MPGLRSGNCHTGIGILKQFTCSGKNCGIKVFPFPVNFFKLRKQYDFAKSAKGSKKKRNGPGGKFKRGFYQPINEDKYRDVKFDLGVQYLFSGVNYIKTYWSVFSSRLLSIDSTAMFDIGRLPVRLDVSVNSLGLQLNFNNLDYMFNPIRGFELVLDGNIGQRKILKNQQIIGLENESISFSDSYDSLKLNTYVFNVSSSVSYYFPLTKNMVFKLSNTTSLKKTEKKCLLKEKLF